MASKLLSGVAAKGGNATERVKEILFSRNTEDIDTESVEMFAEHALVCEL